VRHGYDRERAIQTGIGPVAVRVAALPVALVQQDRGGEFRLGTASIYMAEYEHTRHRRTSVKSWITWLRFRPVPGHIARPIKGLAATGRRKLGLESLDG